MKDTGTHMFGEQAISIVIIEDTISAQEAIRGALARLKIANPLFYVAGGEEALATMRDQVSGDLPEPFIVIMDSSAVCTSDDRVVAEVRADPRLQGSVIYMLTSAADDRQLKSRYKEDIAGFIRKSHLEQDLFKALRRVDEYWQIVALPKAVVNE